MDEIIKAYKGFNKDMTCKGKKYDEGKEYEELKFKSLGVKRSKDDTS